VVLVVALPDLAERLSRLPISGMNYVVNVRQEDARDLRHKVHSYQPHVVILDWRMGGSSWRAIDEVPAIVDRTATHPQVIVILPHRSRVIDREAARKGAYDVVSAVAGDFDRDVCDAVATAKKARQVRKTETSRVSRKNFH
jgi:DNA-binding NtrC family response regulator